jgi:hypothetical protein
MRYMFLVYSRELPETPEVSALTAAAARQHRSLMDDAASRGVLRAADPLTPTATATTVRAADGHLLITDGPFAETKEQLAGYYILECQDLDEAIDWAKRMPTTCHGGAGAVEIRPIRDVGGI